MDDFCRSIPHKFTGKPPPLAAIVEKQLGRNVSCFLYYGCFCCCCCVVTMRNEIFYGTTMNFFRTQKNGADWYRGKQKGAFLELFHSEFSCLVEIGDNLVKLIPLFRSLTARWYKREASAMTFFPFLLCCKGCLYMVFNVWQWSHLFGQCCFNINICV